MWCVQVNKEKIWNEKAGHISMQTTLYRARHRPILPSDYDTFEEFVAAIEQAWQITWERAHALREEYVNSPTGWRPRNTCPEYKDR